MKINRNQLRTILENKLQKNISEGFIDKFLDLLVRWSARGVRSDSRFQKIVKNQEEIEKIDNEIKDMQPQIKKLKDFLNQEDQTGITNLEYIDKYLKDSSKFNNQ